VEAAGVFPAGEVAAAAAASGWRAADDGDPGSGHEKERSSELVEMGVEENICGTAAFPPMLPRKPSARLSGLCALRLALLPGVDSGRDSPLPPSPAPDASAPAFALNPCAKASNGSFIQCRGESRMIPSRDLEKAFFGDLDLGALCSLLSGRDRVGTGCVWAGKPFGLPLIRF
jgi:hypothetical protein